MVKLVVFPPIVNLIEYETFFFANVSAGIVTRPEAETLTFPKETDFPFASTNVAVPEAEAFNPVTTTRVGTSTGI